MLTPTLGASVIVGLDGIDPERTGFSLAAARIAVLVDAHTTVNPPADLPRIALYVK
jgi:hypothetical protein